MSKSLGNHESIRLEVIDKYGADALRLTLVTGNAPGNDMFLQEQVEASRNFCKQDMERQPLNRMNLPEEELPEPSAEDLRPADRWILSRVNTIAKEVYRQYGTL